MGDLDLSLLDAYARGGDPAGPLLLVWGVHEGMRGARWLSVDGEGCLRETRYRPSGEPATEVRLLGRVPRAEVRRLAAALVRADPVHRPEADPAHRLTLEVRWGEERREWALAPSDASRPELVPLVAAFQKLRDLATRPPPGPLDVRLAGAMTAVAVLVGLLTCGVGALALLLVWRRFPRRLDAEGLTLRSGRRYRWEQLRLRERVAEGRVLGYDLLAQDGGQVRLAPGALRNGSAVLAYVRERLGA